MAERLGEALLDIRVNDAGYTSGVEQAKGKAQQLGAQLDRTSGSSAKLATEMVATGRSAQQLGAGFERAGQQVTAAAGAQRAGMQQLSFQIGDIATMYSLGARPAQIFASQIGQVTQAVQMMSGGTSRVAAFLGGPWGIALTAATIVLAPFVGKLFEAEDALEKVELASDNLGDSQAILARVFDLTTGKLKEQSAAAIETARTLQQLALLDAEKQKREAETGLQESSRRKVQVDVQSVGTGSFGGSVFRSVTRETVSAAAARRALAGDPDGALSALRADLAAGRTTPEIFEQVSRQIINLKQGSQNIVTANAGLESLASGNLDPRFREPGAPARAGRASGPKPRSDVQKQEDFDNQTLTLQRQTLQAKLQLATGAEERADIQQQLLDLEREQRITEIEANDLGPARKAALIAQVEALLGTAPIVDEQNEMILSANRGLEGLLISRERARQQARDEADLADIRFRGELDMLQNQMALADTQVAQKLIALRIYDAQVEEERLRLQKIIDLEAIGAVTQKEAEEAKARLAALNANAAGGRKVVEQQNETDAERYLRGLNKTPAQINEALSNIEIDGLEALNDGLAEAIMGAESLGNVFKRVADQIIADLIRIAIQQAIIKPLANSLFGGGGGGGGFLASLFGGGGGGASVGGGASGLGALAARFVGGLATGGTIPTGKFAIVGEEGPELAFAGPGGMGIMSNPASRQLLSAGGGGTNVSIPISIDATGADAAAIARLNARIDQLKDELPGRIVTTVRDARDRRFL